MHNHNRRGAREVVMRRLSRVALVLVAFAVAQAAAARTIEETWLDPARERAISVRVQLPDDRAFGQPAERPGTAHRPVPLVVISIGPGKPHTVLARWVASWVEHGYAVIEITQPGAPPPSAIVDARRTPGSRGVARGVTPEQLLGRSDDVRFVLAELRRRQAEGASPDDAWRHIDLERMAFAGEGANARLVQALAGERYPGPIPSLAEPSFRAFIAAAPATQGVRTSAGARYGAMARPFFSIVVPPSGDAGLPPLPRQLALFDAQPAGGKWRVVPPRTGAARQGTPTPDDPVVDLARAFLDRYVRDAAGAAERLDATATELRSRGYRVDAK